MKAHLRIVSMRFCCNSIRFLPILKTASAHAPPQKTHHCKKTRRLTSRTDGGQAFRRTTMKTRFNLFIIIALSLAGSVVNARAGWPEKVFAPYMYVGVGDQFKLTDCDDACGQKFYTLAFIIADPSNNPAWDGRTAMAENFYTNQIAAIRARGGDVIISFGGEGGQEIALVETNATALQEKYQAVVDRYHFTSLDFDIEGEALKKDAVNARRNTALARLQAQNPGLLISYTLPVDPKGISDHSQRLLRDAKAKGLKIRSAN